MKNMLKLLCELTAPRFIGPWGMDTAGRFPMPWVEDAKWEKPSRLHIYLCKKLTEAGGKP